MCRPFCHRWPADPQEPGDSAATGDGADGAVLAERQRPHASRVSTLARRANITPQALGELVDDLERLGYVKRRPDPADRRAKLIVLTARGRAAVAAAMDVIAALEAELAALLGSDRVAALHAMVEQIRTATDA